MVFILLKLKQEGGGGGRRKYAAPCHMIDERSFTTRFGLVRIVQFRIEVVFLETIYNQYAKQYMSWILSDESGYDSNNICILS